MSIKIEKGIPIPATYGKYSKYPFADMKEGDSFIIEKDIDIAAVRQAASHYAKRSGKNIRWSIRKTADGHRCWRVK